MWEPLKSGQFIKRGLALLLFQEDELSMTEIFQVEVGGGLG